MDRKRVYLFVRNDVVVKCKMARKMELCASENQYKFRRSGWFDDRVEISIKMVARLSFEGTKDRSVGDLKGN